MNKHVRTYVQLFTTWWRLIRLICGISGPFTFSIKSSNSTQNHPCIVYHDNDVPFCCISEDLMIVQTARTHSGFLQTLNQWHKTKGGHAVTSGLEPWHSDLRHSCLGPGSLVCVPVRTCTLWSFICRSLSITAMFPEPDHLQQLKMPLQLAGSAGLCSTLHYIIKRSCFANGCKGGSGFNPLSRSARRFPHSVPSLIELSKAQNKMQIQQQQTCAFFGLYRAHYCDDSP